MTVVFVSGMVSIVMLLALLTLISTLIGQRLPQLTAAVDAGLKERQRRPALRYAS